MRLLSCCERVKGRWLREIETKYIWERVFNGRTSFFLSCIVFRISLHAASVVHFLFSHVLFFCGLAFGWQIALCAPPA